VFLLLGLGLSLLGEPEWAFRTWMVGLVLVGLPVVVRTARGALRGVLAADLVATLAMVTAVLLVAPLPGLVVAMMQTGGEALERFAERRATRAVQELEAQAPRTAHRRVGDAIEDVPADVILVQDLLLVRPGEMVPCDGEVTGGESAVDISRITGEPVPLFAQAGTVLRSGSLVLDGALTLRATARARESLYARVVELVRTAQASKAPLQRAADRAAVWFTPTTLLVCAVAWLLSQDPNRVLAVLVVATPCPLLLATPVAIVGGINRAARRRIILRHGGAVEGLAAVDTVVFDKTGTITLGRPEVRSVEARPPMVEREAMRLAAGVEQSAGHPLARSLVRAAEAQGLSIPTASGVTETPGRGVRGRVEGHLVTVGGHSFLREVEPQAAAQLRRVDGSSELQALVVVDGQAAAIVRFADSPRPGVPRVLERLRELGLRKQVLLSGDDWATTEAVGRAVGLAEVAGDLLPGDKVAHIIRLRKAGLKVLMVGDGINDAPALSAATVGMALAEHGGGIAAESADVVLLEDDLSRVADAVAIGRDTMRIARQSLAAGLGLSLAAMGVAALGYIPPVGGAVLQEAIDLAVILNALRAAR
jgi:heavy metal translocating P-type ATPase